MSALEQCHLEQPDLVLLDLLMHGMYGLDVLVKLREMNSAVRVIVVSADIQKSTREMATEGGALAFINKPFNPTTLLETVKETLGKGSPRNGTDRTTD
jgi:two-component system chemotaxis response regulator CheY